MGLQAGASAATRAGSEARGCEGGTTGVGRRDEDRGGGAREQEPGRGPPRQGGRRGLPGSAFSLRVGIQRQGVPLCPEPPGTNRPGSRRAARAALRSASYLCCLCRPPSCCGAVTGERPVAKLGGGVLTPSSPAASRLWRMGGSEPRGRRPWGGGGGKERPERACPPLQPEPCGARKPASAPATLLAASVASACSAQHRALNPDFSSYRGSI